MRQAIGRGQSVFGEVFQQLQDEVIKVLELRRPQERAKSCLVILRPFPPDNFAQARLVSHERLRVAAGRDGRPAQCAVLDERLHHSRVAQHPPRQRPQQALHQREVLHLVVGGEENGARPELCEDAPHTPQVDRVRPRKLERHLRRPVLPRADNRRVMLMLPRGAAEVDEDDVEPRRRGAPVRRRLDQQDVLGLEVRVRQPDLVKVGKCNEAVVRNRGDLAEAEVRARLPVRHPVAAQALDVAPYVAQTMVQRRPHRLEHKAEVPAMIEAAQQLRDGEVGRGEGLLHRQDDLRLDVRRVRVLLDGAHHLDRHSTPCLCVQHLDHSAKRALPKLALHAVPMAVELVADLKHVVPLPPLLVLLRLGAL
mmetsp:Transcript_8943/g.18636  ORF Transcript_8943/g.18636 Transcript_8943/m.18636 type:complete len:366 (-) Transcript_8943:16-1113(-)